MTHIRTAFRRTFRTTSSGYVRRSGSVGGTETLCGGSMTDRDASVNDWRSYVKAGEDVCIRCIDVAEPY